MKKLWVILLIFSLCFSGCSSQNGDMDKALTLRQALQDGQVSFDAEITADYLQEAQCFTLHCCSKDKGQIEFTVTSPECIADITGIMGEKEGRLTYESTVLAFPMLAEGLISPVAAPWVMMEALKGGYLVSCGKLKDQLQLVIGDRYAEEEIRVEILLNEDNTPAYGEIYWKDCRILSLNIENFKIQ